MKTEAVETEDDKPLEEEVENKTWIHGYIMKTKIPSKQFVLAGRRH